MFLNIHENVTNQYHWFEEDRYNEKFMILEKSIELIVYDLGKISREHHEVV
jgi:hypothetical protein